MTPEQKLMNAMFPTPANQPWPEGYQPDSGLEWAERVGMAIKARANGPLGVLEAAFACLIIAEVTTEDPDALLAAGTARQIVQDCLDYLDTYGK